VDFEVNEIKCKGATSNMKYTGTLPPLQTQHCYAFAPAIKSLTKLHVHTSLSHKPWSAFQYMYFDCFGVIVLWYNQDSVHGCPSSSMPLCIASSDRSCFCQ
jgi:hypothetical protein